MARSHLCHLSTSCAVAKMSPNGTIIGGLDSVTRRTASWGMWARAGLSSRRSSSPEASGRIETRLLRPSMLGLDTANAERWYALGVYGSRIRQNSGFRGAACQAAKATAGRLFRVRGFAALAAWQAAPLPKSGHFGYIAAVRAWSRYSQRWALAYSTGAGSIIRRRFPSSQSTAPRIRSGSPAHPCA